MARRREDFPVVPPRVFDRPGVLDVNQQDYASQQAKAFGIQVGVPGKLLPGLSVGVQLDDYTAPEFWWLRRGVRGYAGTARAAQAGQFNFFALQCLPGSVVVVEKLIISREAVTDFVTVGIQAAQPAAAAATTGTATDSRAFGQGGAARWVLSSNAAVSGPVIPTTILTPASQQVIIDTPWVITDGYWLSVIAASVNTPLAVVAFYRERRLLETEK